MDSKSFIWIGLAIGSTVGGCIPLIWGGSTFSFASIILSAVGGIAGIWFGFRIANW